jgi:hypothetical protein
MGIAATTTIGITIIAATLTATTTAVTGAIEISPGTISQPEGRMPSGSRFSSSGYFHFARVQSLGGSTEFSLNVFPAFAVKFAVWFRCVVNTRHSSRRIFRLSGDFSSSSINGCQR